MSQIRALQMLSDTELALRLIDPPPPPGPGEVQLRVRFVGINHIDVFGLRGMAFAKRLYPLSVGAEAACEVVAVGEGVTNVAPGDRVVPFSAYTCGTAASACEAATIFAKTSSAFAVFTSTAGRRTSPTIRRG